MARKSPWLHLRHAAILLGGALVYLLLAAGPLGFRWTPLLLGIVAAMVAITDPDDRVVRAVAAVLCLWGAAIVAGVAPAERLLDALTFGSLAEAPTYALGLGLLGALEVVRGINPAPGRGRGPDLR